MLRFLLCPVRLVNPLFLLAGFVIVSAISWPVMKIGVAHMPPFWFSEARLIWATALLLVIARFAGARNVLPERGDWPVVFGVGLTQMTLFVAFSHFGLTVASAGRAAVLVYTTPLWVAPLAWLLLRERLGWRQLAGAALGLAGIVVLFDPARFDWADRRVVIANGALLVAALAWAVAILQIRAHRWHGTALQTAPWQMMVGVVLLLPVAWLVEGAPFVGWEWPALPALAYTATFATALAFWCILTLGQRVPATTVAVGSLGTPALGVLLSAAVLGEPLTPAVLAALGLIMAGVLITVLRRSVAA